MTVDDLSQRIIGLSQHIDELQKQYMSDPASTTKVLTDALEELQISLEELSAAEEELMQQNENLIAAQEALKKSKEHYRTAIDFTYDWEYWVDPAGKYVYVSPSCERISGYSAEEFMQDQGLLERIIHPQDRPLFSGHLLQGEGAEKPIDFRIVARNGEERWISHICQPVYGSDGNYLGRRASNRDITERKQAEQTVEYQAMLLGQVQDAVIGSDASFRITYWNKGAELMFGFTNAEALGKTPLELLRPTYDPGERDSIFEDLERKGMSRAAIRTKHKDGSDIIAEVHSTRLTDATGRTLGFVVVYRDITERKRAEEALHESESILHGFFDSPGAMRGIIEVVADDDVRHIADNGVTAGFLGQTPEDMKGKLGSELGEPPEILRTWIGYYRQSQRTGEPVSFEYLDRREDREAWLSAIVSYLGTTPEGTQRFAYLVIDITDRKRTEQALQEAKDRLEMRVRERTAELENANARLQEEIAERTDAEEALRAANAYNRSLIEASPDPLVTIGPDGRVTDVNAATEAVTDYSREELIGTDFSNYFTQPDSARAGYEQVFKEGFVRDYALEILHRDGHITPVLYNASVYKNDAGDIVGVFAAARDITAQMQASRYARSLIESSLDPLVTIRADGKIMDVNEATINVTGVPRDQLIGTDFSSYFIEPEKARDGYQQVFAKGFVKDYPLTILHRDGRLTDVLYNASIYKDIRGQVLGVFAAARDVTERRRAEMELDNYRRHLEDLVRERTHELEAANAQLHAEITERKQMEVELERLASFPRINPNPIIEVDMDGLVHFLNPAADQLFPDLKEGGRNHPWLIDWEQVAQILHKSKTGTYVRDIFVGDSWYQQSMHLVPGAQRIRIYGLNITERKRAEEALHESMEELEVAAEELHQQNDELLHTQSALQESEEKYRTIVETANEGIWVVDSEIRTTYVNKRMGEMLGYSPEEMIGKRSSDFMDEEEKARLGLALERRRRGIKESLEFKFIRKNGSILWALSSSSPLWDSDGRFAGSLGMLTDITERKKAEDALQVLLQQRQLALDAARMGWWHYDPSTGISSWDDRYKEIFGVAGCQSPNDEILKQLHPEDLPGVLAKVEAALDPTNPQPYFAEYRINRHDGSMRWIEAHGVALFEGAGDNRRAVSFVGTVADITERKQAEEELRRRQIEIQALFDNTPAGLVLFNASPPYTVLVHNRYYQELFAEPFRSRGMVGLNVYDYAPEVEAAGVVAVFDEVVRTKQAKSFLDFPYNSNPPKESWFNWHMSPIILDGRVIALVSMSVDVTDRHRAEEELQKARDELELRVQERTAELSDAKENLEVINEELQVEISEHEKTEKELIAAKEEAEAAVEAKAAFLANMSHELRTPLNAVIGYSSLLLDDSLTSEQKENIEAIRNGGEALLAIISDILEFSRAEKERITLENQPFSLKRCVEESMDMVAVHASQKGLKLSYTIGYGTPDNIIGDHGRLRQILANLLSNAVKFTDAGEVSISVSSKMIEGNKREITFAVKDTGIGMPQDKMDRLFEPFTQLEYVISRKRDGAGLGLAISRKLVELMGGEIWAESAEEKGSTFRFTIQAETIPGRHLDSDSCERDGSEYRNLSIEKPLSILVAEDNPSNQKVLVEMLKRLGYRPDAVADGIEVLQALQIRPYDLIFMDIRMPEMDGLTATKEIRKLWPYKGPRVVAITAFAMEGDREMCIEAGMDGYIAKPVKMSDLADVLGRCKSF